MGHRLVVSESSQRGHTWTWLGAIALGVALVGVACGEKDAPEPIAPAPLPVKMFRVPEGGVDGTVEYPGRIQAWLHSEMAFENSGRIIDFRVVEGDRVEEGDVLVRLDPRDFVSDVEAATATLAQARADYDRYSVLFKEGVSSVSEFQAKKEHFKVSKSALAQAKKALEEAELIAPFSGLIARKLVDDFENVSAKQSILILQDVSRLKIKTAVPETDLAGRQKNPTREEINSQIQSSVVISTLPNEAFPAQLGELALTADPTTRTFDATFYFDTPETFNILPGMTAKVRVSFTNSDEGSYLIPGAAVWATDTGAPRVWRVDSSSNTVEEVAVELGPMAGASIQVTGGIKPGDILATSGVNELAAGRLVREFVR